MDNFKGQVPLEKWNHGGIYQDWIVPYSWLGEVNSVERTERGDDLEDGLSTAELGACLKDAF